VRLLYRLIAVLPVVAAAVCAQQPDLNGLSLEELGNIEVTSVSKGPVKLSQTPAAIYVITQEDIRRSGARSLPEALRLAPGVDVAQIDDAKWAVGIRGFQSRLSRDILVLIDGRSVYDPLFHGVYWEVQDTLLEDIDRIEVIRGPGGTIWGANAVNGVINIITKSAKDTKGTLVSGGGGSVNQGFLDFREGGGNDRFSYRVYGKGTDTGAQYHFNHHNFDDQRRAQGGFRTDWDIDPATSLTIQGDIYDGIVGEEVRISTLAPPGAPIIDKNAELSGGNILTRFQRKFHNGSDIQLEAYYDRFNRLQANQTEYRNMFDVDFVDHFRLTERQEFIVGVETRLSPAHVPAAVPTYVFTPDERTDHLFTAYAQDSISLVPDKVALTAGTKLLHSSFTGFDVEPSVRLLVTPTARRTFWAAATRAVRTPSDIEDTLTNTAFVSANPLTYSVTKGNGRFTSETLLGYEAGYRSLLSRNLSIDIAAFYNSYNHLQSLEPGTPFMEQLGGNAALILPYFNGNGVKGNTAGIEIAPDWKPRPWWRLQGSYSWLHMDLRLAQGSRDPTTIVANEGSSPHQQVKVQSWFDLSRNLELNLTFRYIGVLPYYRVAGYSTGDARLAWRPVRGVEFAVTGQNLLQPHHVEYGVDPSGPVGIRRSVYASLTYRK
jgi:iron complex outermembrane receptor protein